MTASEREDPDPWVGYVRLSEMALQKLEAEPLKRFKPVEQVLLPTD